MASFVLSMANTFLLKFSTMQGYARAIRELHTQSLGSVGDPLDGVLDWSKFMNALHVQSYVDATVESHVMVPFQVMVQVLLRLDRGNRSHVVLGCMLLMMYYTMARSQTPLPKTKDGFDPAVHLRRKDVRRMPGTDNVEWGLGVVKNSTRSKRAANDPEDRTWKPVGACTGVLSMFFWLDLYLSMSEFNSGTDPLFVDESGAPYTYAFMLRLFRTRISLLPGFDWNAAKIYGFHGLRVLGFNCARAAAGEDVAVLQGGWASDAFKTYSKEQLLKLLGMAQLGADYAASHALPDMPMDAVPVPLTALPVDGPLPQEARPPPLATPAPAPSAPSGAIPAAVVPDLPIDAEREVRTATSRSYVVWKWRGVAYGSRPQLRAAYQKEKEFLTVVSAFGYTSVAAPDASSS